MRTNFFNSSESMKKRTSERNSTTCRVFFTSVFLVAFQLVPKAEPVVERYANGQVKVMANKSGDDLDGKWTTWYENGRKRDEGYHQKGKRIGVWRQWYENGTLAVVHKFEAGREVDTAMLYYEGGGPKLMTVYSDNGNSEAVTAWHSNGVKACSFSYVNDQFHGIYESWYDDGSLRTRRFYIKGEQVDSNTFIRLWPVDVLDTANGPANSRR